MRPNSSNFQIFLWLSAIEGITTLILLLRIPTDTNNMWLLGYSLGRFFLIIGIAFIDAFLIWLAIIFWRETQLSRQIHIKIIESSSKGGLLRGILLITILLTVSGCLFLFQWILFDTDQQLIAYLIRLTPIVLFGTLVCIQLIIFLKLNLLRSKKENLIFVLIILAGVILFQWLLIAEYYLADLLFPDYYVKIRYAELFNTWMPIILFQTALFIQIPYLLRKKLNISLNFGWFGIILIFILAYFYYNATTIHAQDVNTDLSRSDQDVYVEFTRRVSETDFTYTGVRNQTPGYPFIQALFCKADMNDFDLFMCGKKVNVILSMVFIFLLFFIFKYYLQTYQTVVLLLIILVSLFIFKAGYMTVELSFYFGSFLSFLLMCIMLINPSIKLGVLTGIILGLTYYLKASILPGIILFIVVFLFKVSWDLFRRESTKTNLNIHFVSLITTICCFFLVVLPYIQQSKETYGQYFYNVNSTFYIWYDSWEEAKQAEINYGFTLGWPDLPADQLPGVTKYLREHTIAQILERLNFGLNNQIYHLLNQFNLINYLIFYSILLIGYLLLNFAYTKYLLRKYFYIIIFAVFYMLGYILLFAWYFPIAGGPRFLAGLFIPILFSIFIVLNKLVYGEKLIKLKNCEFKHSTSLSLINLLVIAILIFDLYITITEKLPNGYFGS